MLLVILAGTQTLETKFNRSSPTRISYADPAFTSTAIEVPATIPTVSIPETTAITIPTVMIPQPTAHPTPTSTPKPKPRPTKQHPKPRTPPRSAVQREWIIAYLTSYCPGSAGWISSSGSRVFYGMLANNFYRFGTRVYMPVLGITGVVLDRVGSFAVWNHFDVWSPTCYGTPTGWFKVAVQTR